MTVKYILLCINTLLVQVITSQCIGNINVKDFAATNNVALATNALQTANAIGRAADGGVNLASNAAGLTAGINNLILGSFDASSINNGGAFRVVSASPNAPTGMSSISNGLNFDGPLAVTGNMPFLGTVAFDGPLGASGTGAVSYGAGDGSLGITSERAGSVANAAAASVATNGCANSGLLSFNGFNAGLVALDRSGLGPSGCVCNL